MNERAEVFVLLKKKLEHKNESIANMDVTNWLISSLHFLLETWNHIKKCSRNTGGMFWIYNGTLSTRAGLKG